MTWRGWWLGKGKDNTKDFVKEGVVNLAFLEQMLVVEASIWGNLGERSLSMIDK